MYIQRVLLTYIQRVLLTYSKVKRRIRDRVHQTRFRRVFLVRLPFLSPPIFFSLLSTPSSTCFPHVFSVRPPLLFISYLFLRVNAITSFYLVTLHARLLRAFCHQQNECLTKRVVRKVVRVVRHVPLGGANIQHPILKPSI